MGDSDAEWVGVDFEFPRAGDRTTARPVTTRRPVTSRPVTRRPVHTERPVPGGSPHDAPEVEGPGSTKNPNSIAIISGAVGGILGLVLMLLIVYMLVLRRRLNKAKVASTDSQYQLRVEDVAHLTNIDESSNTYVNTTDLQKLMSTVRAKKKSEERLPTMPKIQHQTPTPYRPPLPDPKSHSSTSQTENKAYTPDPDVVVVRAPMPIPHNKETLHDTCNPQNNWKPAVRHEPEALYSNLQPSEPFVLSNPPPRKKVEAPKLAPPPPPTNQKKTYNDNNMEKGTPLSSSVIARPAPPPPTLVKTKSVEAVVPPQTQKPLLPGASKPTPPVAPKPNKGAQPITIGTPLTSTDARPAPPTTSKPTPPAIIPTTSTSKPTPIIAPKVGVLNKGRGLPPLKMALLPSLNKSSVDNCRTPDTGIIELTPEHTPIPGSENSVATGSISSKIAFLEGKMKTPILPTRAMPPKT